MDQNLDTNQNIQEPIVEVEANEPKQIKKSSRKVLMGLLVALPVIGVIGFVFLTIRSSSERIEIESGGQVESVSVEEEQTPSPVPEIDKEEVLVNVLNGTGIVGEAAYLRGILAGIGFEKIEVGNADSEDRQSASVSFSDRIPQSMQEEVVSKLESAYTDVEVAGGAPSGDFDIEVITGSRPGVEKKTPTPKPTSTATVSPAATPTSTSTPAATATPTP